MKLPPCLPDELLFSRVIRFITILGTTETQFLRETYGKPYISFHPYFPPIVTALLKLTHENADTLILEQTMAPYFMRFIPQCSKKIENAMLKGDTNTAINLAKIRVFKQKQKLTIKYCPQCVIENIKIFGVAYWHRCHQFMGIESCYKHQVLLIHKDASTAMKLGVGIPPIISEINPSSLIDFELAKYAANYLNNIIKKELTNGLDYTEVLKELGYINCADHVRRRYLIKDFYYFTKKLKHISADFLPLSKFDVNYLRCVLNKSKSQHPIKHLLFLFWISKQNNKKSNTSICLKSNILESQCINLLKKGLRLAEIQRVTKKSQCYIKKIAVKNGLFKPYKAKKINDKMKDEIIKLAFKGFKREAIVKRYNISKASFHFIILSVNGLALWRRTCKYESIRRRQKIKIIRYLQQNLNANRTDLKINANGAYCWLMKNEKDWLDSNTPIPMPRWRNFHNNK